MPTYARAELEILELVEQVRDDHFPALRDLDVQIEVLWAFPPCDRNGDPTGPAIKVQGKEAAAKIRVTKIQERLMGRADAEITIANDHWTVMAKNERPALIDHQLEHLVIKLDNEGNAARDDAGRPCLKLQPHDHQFGWFTATVRRHGPASGEVRQLRDFLDGPYKQLWLPFAEPAQKGRKKAS